MSSIETVATLAIAVHLGLMFLVAGVAKALAPASFTSVLHRDRLLPQGGIRVLGLGVPWLEMVLGLWLLSGFLANWSAAFATSGLGCFVAYSLARVVNHRPVSVGCGCFGTWRRPEGQREVTVGTSINFGLALTQWRVLSGHLVIPWPLSIAVAAATCVGVGWITWRQYRMRSQAPWLRRETTAEVI